MKITKVQTSQDHVHNLVAGTTVIGVVEPVYHTPTQRTWTGKFDCPLEDGTTLKFVIDGVKSAKKIIDAFRAELGDRVVAFDPTAVKEKEFKKPKDADATPFLTTGKGFASDLVAMLAHEKKHGAPAITGMDMHV